LWMCIGTSNRRMLVLGTSRLRECSTSLFHPARGASYNVAPALLYFHTPTLKYDLPPLRLPLAAHDSAPSISCNHPTTLRATQRLRAPRRAEIRKDTRPAALPSARISTATHGVDGVMAFPRGILLPRNSVQAVERLRVAESGCGALVDDRCAECRVGLCGRRGAGV
jgi:hypothetical protein